MEKLSEKDTTLSDKIRQKIAIFAALSLITGCNDILAGSERIILTDNTLDERLERVTSSFLNGEIDKSQAETEVNNILSKAGIDPGIQYFQRECRGQGEFCGNGVFINRNSTREALRKNLINNNTRKYAPRKQ